MRRLLYRENTREAGTTLSLLKVDKVFMTIEGEFSVLRGLPCVRGRLPERERRELQCELGERAWNAWNGQLHGMESEGADDFDRVDWGTGTANGAPKKAQQ